MNGYGSDNYPPGCDGPPAEWDEEDDDVVSASTLRDEIECGEDADCACAACAAEAVSL